MKHFFFLLVIAILGVACTTDSARNAHAVTVLSSDDNTKKDFYLIVEHLDNGYVQSIKWDDSRNIPRNYYKNGDTVIVVKSYYSDGELSLYESGYIYGKNSNAFIKKGENFSSYNDSLYSAEYSRAIVMNRLLK